MKSPIDDAIRSQLDDILKRIENHTESDFIYVNTDIGFGLAGFINKLIQDLQENPNYHHDKARLVFMLTTPGGSVEEVSRIVSVTRKFYKEVYFIVPDYAYSAGTILCMSGDEIYMDYFSVLGPIDPQVQNKERSKLIPAQGYLDKVDEFVEKSKNGTLSDAEYMMLKEIDLADLRSYEQARELSIDLLKKWLVQYKFKNWERHESSSGDEVSSQDKVDRAAWIASQLSDNNLWKTHGRGIDIHTLRNNLKLKINDYSEDVVLCSLVREYYDLIVDFMFEKRADRLFHTRGYL